MSSIGPQIPSHCLPTVSKEESNDAESDDGSYGPAPPTSIGPQIPQHLPASTSSGKAADEQEQEESDDDGYAPALPPDLVATRKAGPSSPPLKSSAPSVPTAATSSDTSRRPVGPSFPSSYDDDSDDDIGPKPLPAYVGPAREKSGVEEFLEREERIRKKREEEKNPKEKKLQRDEWMLVPPKAGDLLSSLDPTRMKARQFAKSSGPSARDTGSSLWTETPAERQQRIADEVAGRKRPAANAEPESHDDDESRKRRRRDAEIRRGVEEHTRKARGSALVDAHASSQSSKPDDGEPPVIWDHARDMSLGGRLMDDSTRKKMLQDAKSLGDRFSGGKSGGYL
ncbi:hypothetical protein CONPUDRAFT_160938 [Coniophora puteana RWD-64-598 SS2]|uniref:DUF3752 domain-containing protein n=1 Tax=Coniophora puteana (strain RWD-64-598) TaxID=741705 RepID=A0A5M3N4V4_CONPW|nr:uncharacterized protein CONPUDRAFT_160938 [Coniophora puteana RWD-64-598 SS2]EIW86084.1 hypothetical protein CONPUDRAFT_160938 [Coniophora puteana RWD-64-598 SS2]